VMIGRRTRTRGGSRRHHRSCSVVRTQQSVATRYAHSRPLCDPAAALLVSRWGSQLLQVASRLAVPSCSPLTVLWCRSADSSRRRSLDVGARDDVVTARDAAPEGGCRAADPGAS
jgi:hypothetical protein